MGQNSKPIDKHSCTYLHVQFLDVKVKLLEKSHGGLLTLRLQATPYGFDWKMTGEILWDSGDAIVGVVA